MDSRYCLHGDGSEEVVDFLLFRIGLGVDGKGVVAGAVDFLHAEVACDGAHVVEQGLEAVDRGGVVEGFRADFSEGLAAALGRGDRIAV